MISQLLKAHHKTQKYRNQSVIFVSTVNDTSSTPATDFETTPHSLAKSCVADWTGHDSSGRHVNAQWTGRVVNDEASDNGS